jgi:hypothetical protein
MRNISCLKPRIIYKHQRAATYFFSDKFGAVIAAKVVDSHACQRVKETDNS